MPDSTIKAERSQPPYSVIDFKPVQGKNPGRAGAPAAIIAGSVWMAAILFFVVIPRIIPPTYVNEELGVMESFNLFLVLFFLAGLALTIFGIQEYVGPTSYELDDSKLWVRHAIGKTAIPFNQIDEVSEDIVQMIIKGEGKGSTSWFENSKNQKLDIGIGTLIFHGPSLSTCNGKCLLLSMKNEKIIPLTPEDPEEMMKALTKKMTPVI
jgi:hypothetical protein